MKVLVVGRDGQLGTSLMEAEPPQGMILLHTGLPECDIRDAASVEAAIAAADPDVIVNAAAYTAVDKAEDEEALAFAVNADGPENIGRAAAARDIPVIHVSTDYVYEGNKAEPYVESDPVRPLGAYGRSKLAGEERLRQAQPHSIILRTAWLHSPFGGNFVKTMLRVAETKPVVRVVADQHGNPTYAPHLADAVLAIAGRIGAEPGEIWGVYHAVGTGAVNWSGLAEAIFAESRRWTGPTAEVEPIATSEYPTRAVRPANSRLDCGKLASVFGVTLPRWQEGVAAGVERLLGDSGGPGETGRLAQGGTS